MLGHLNLGLLAGIITLLGFVPYCLAIVQGRTKPNQATWWIWSIVGIMLASSYWASGATQTLWVPISYVIGPIITTALAMRYGASQWSRFDRLCILGAFVSLILWFVLRSPQVALVINLIIDLFGALPTIRNAWHRPQDEDLTGWLIFTVGNAFNVLAIDRWTWEIASYPLYITFANGIVLSLLLRPRKKQAL
jgi:zinc transporter ZupT